MGALDALHDKGLKVATANHERFASNISVATVTGILWSVQISVRGFRETMPCAHGWRTTRPGFCYHFSCSLGVMFHTLSHGFETCLFYDNRVCEFGLDRSVAWSRVDARSGGSPPRHHRHPHSAEASTSSRCSARSSSTAASRTVRR